MVEIWFVTYRMFSGAVAALSASPHECERDIVELWTKEWVHLGHVGADPEHITAGSG